MDTLYVPNKALSLYYFEDNSNLLTFLASSAKVDPCRYKYCILINQSLYTGVNGWIPFPFLVILFSAIVVLPQEVLFVSLKWAEVAFKHIFGLLEALWAICIYHFRSSESIHILVQRGLFTAISISEKRIRRYSNKKSQAFYLTKNTYSVQIFHRRIDMSINAWQNSGHLALFIPCKWY